jgi:hypothetical protein
MFKGMWNEFWGKLGDKEKNVVKAVGFTAVGVALLVGVGQLTKPKPNPVLEQITEGLRKPTETAHSDNKKPAQ